MVPRKRTLLGRGSVVLALVHLARWVAPLEAYLPHQHRHGGLRMDPYPRQPPHGRTTDAAAATAGVTAGRRGGTRQQSAPPKPSFGRAVVVVQQAASAAAPQQQQHDVNTNVVATETAIAVPSTTKDLNDEIARLCGTGDLDRAMELLDRHQPHGGHDGGVSTVAVANHKTYTRLLTAYATSADTVDRATLDCVEDLWSRLQQQQQQQQLSSRSSLRTAYNAVILAWSKSYSRQAGHRCDELLTELWVQYNVTQNRHWCPLHSTYVSTLTAWARSQIGPRAAERAEAILQEMERWGQQSLTTAHLKPTATCYNIVLYVGCYFGSVLFVIFVTVLSCKVRGCEGIRITCQLPRLSSTLEILFTS